MFFCTSLYSVPESEGMKKSVIFRKFRLKKTAENIIFTENHNHQGENNI